MPASAPAAPRRAGPFSVGRILTILESVAGSREGVNLSELARQAGAPKTSLVGLLAGLTAEGCLVRDDVGRYTLGPRFHALALRSMAGRDFVGRARPVLEALVATTGETAVIGALAPDADLAVYLDKVESTDPIRYAVTVGERRELYCTALGKALLAHFAPARLRGYLRDTRRERFTATTLTRAADLERELARVRREGIARTSGERVAWASGLAAPIVDATGSVVAALLIAGPSERMRANAERNETALRRAAAECSRLTGGAERPRETG
jgi:DNA-binding IclR family transcriptional regulator